MTTWYMVGRILTLAEQEAKAKQVAAECARLRSKMADSSRVRAITAHSTEHDDEITKVG